VRGCVLLKARVTSVSVYCEQDSVKCEEGSGKYVEEKRAIEKRGNRNARIIDLLYIRKSD
jgi:hypothetical protein